MATVPPCTMAIWRTRVRPTPLPCRLVVKKGTKTFSRWSGGMPGPLSATCDHDAPVRVARGADSAILPSCVSRRASMALRTRLISAWSSSSASAVDLQRLAARPRSTSAMSRAASSSASKPLQPREHALASGTISSLRHHALGEAAMVLHEMQQAFAAPRQGLERFARHRPGPARLGSPAAMPSATCATRLSGGGGQRGHRA